MKIKKTKQKKWIENIFMMWLITLVIAGIGFLAQQLLPIIFKKDKYMEMVMNEKDTIIIIVICGLISIAIAFVKETKSAQIQEYVEQVSQKKSNRFVGTVFSVFFCGILSLIVITSVISGVVTAKNVKTVSGTVDNVVSATSESNGAIAKMIVVKDSDGKKHRFYKNSYLDDIDVSRKDNITLDYVKTAKQEPKSIDGDALGYVAHTKDTKS